jgi:SAM-dependent methyltransferase
MSEPEKLKLVQALHRMNSMMMIYGRYIEILEPLFSEIAGATGKQVRLLELASGSGGLAFAIAEYAQKNRLNISVKASDIIPEFVSAGNRHAEERRLPVTFRLINAFDMHHLGPDEFDIVVISQSMHHFTPGQLALMIAQAKQHTTTAFVGIDGHRSMLLLGGVPLVASLQGMIPFAQDGLTSARKFYSDLELDIITRIATGENNHRVTCSWPMSILTIRFDGKNP